MDPTAQTGALRRVSCRLELDVIDGAVLAVQVAASPAGALVSEELDVRPDGAELALPVEEVSTPGGRVHIVRADTGVIVLRYAATVAGGGHELGPAAPSTDPVTDHEAVVALRQSRYCPSDALAGYAAVEFGAIPRGPELGAAVASWVFERLAYEAGSSGPLDTALDTLVANAGVCRDFAHLTITLCRSLGMPARLAAVYAPGLSPMDFHAVVEVRWADEWEVLDPTRLAPRPSLVRIATGRDAADTAFLSTLRGEVELLGSEVSAVVEGDLPADDHRRRVALDG